MRYIFKFIILISMLFYFAACNKKTSLDSPVNNNNLSAKDQKAVYPHDKDFFKNHGKNYLDSKAQCLACHGEDGAGRNTKVSCTSCHQNFPHPGNWVMKDQHASQFLQNPQSCSNCHGQDWNGGKSNVSCQQCHQGYPHPLSWAKPDNHGKFFAKKATKEERQNCLSCHDSKNQKHFATQCASCHVAYPDHHTAEFMEAGGGKHKALGMTYDGKCLSCHRDYKDNMPNYQGESVGIGCIGCHDGKILIQWKASGKAAAIKTQFHKTHKNVVEGPASKEAWWRKSVREPSNSKNSK